jgi:hypothetical protein
MPFFVQDAGNFANIYDMQNVFFYKTLNAQPSEVGNFATAMGVTQVWLLLWLTRRGPSLSSSATYTPDRRRWRCQAVDHQLGCHQLHHHRQLHDSGGLRCLERR